MALDSIIKQWKVGAIILVFVLLFNYLIVKYGTKFLIPVENQAILDAFKTSPLISIILIVGLTYPLVLGIIIEQSYKRIR